MDHESSRHRERDRHDRERRPDRSHAGDDHRSKRRRSPDDRRERRAHDRDRDREHRHSRSERHRDQDGDQSDTSEGPAPLDPKLAELGALPLSQDDYFQKAAEFKVWLAQSKRKYLDEISSKDARRYFDKFVDKWNRGRLPDDFYLGRIRSAAAPSSSQTRHKWGFAAKASYTQQEQEVLDSVRDTVDTMTNAQSRGAIEAREAERRAGKRQRLGGVDDEDVELKGSGSNTGARDSGWGGKGASAASSYAERQYEREAAAEAQRRQDAGERRRSNRDARELAEEMAPRATGRDALIEKRREKNAANREFANRKEDDGFEMDDSTLLGGGDDFQKALQERERSRRRREGAREERKAERQSEMSERVTAMRSREDETMAMFKQLAQQRFGGGSS